MTKTDLINKLYESAAGKLTRVEAERAVGHLLESMLGALVSGESVTISGFGSLRPVRRAPRKGRNPRTGEEVAIPAASAIKFTPGKALKDALS